MNVDKYITTKSKDLSVASTSGIQTNASVDHSLITSVDVVNNKLDFSDIKGYHPPFLNIDNRKKLLT